METHRISLPFTDQVLQQQKAGDRLLLTGVLYGARDEAHKRIVDLKRRGMALPVNLRNQVIYYSGPSPAKPGQVIGSAGPTTAKRMDPYTKDMLELGVVGIIGKGERGEETKKLLKGKAIYMAALGGTGAKLSKHVVKDKVIAFEDAGMEALRRLEVVDFPVIVIHDLEGNDAYETLRKSYKL